MFVTCVFLGQGGRGDISDPDSISSDEIHWMFSCFKCVSAHATVCCTVRDECTCVYACVAVCSCCVLCADA